MPGNSSSGGHDGADQVGATAASLASLEVAIAGGSAALARLEDVGIHAQTHGAARFAPVEPGIAKHLVKSLALGLKFNCLRPRHDHGTHPRMDAVALDDAGGLAQVFQ